MILSFLYYMQQLPATNLARTILWIDLVCFSSSSFFPLLATFQRSLYCNRATNYDLRIRPCLDIQLGHACQNAGYKKVMNSNPGEKGL